MKKKRSQKPSMMGKVRLLKKGKYGPLRALQQQLEIEASLNNIQAQVLVMRKPEDMLIVCKAINKELRALGFPGLTNSMIGFYFDDSQPALHYDCANKASGITRLTEKDHPTFERLIRHLKSRRSALVKVMLEGNELNEFKAFRESGSEKPDVKIRDAKALYLYFHPVGAGTLGVTNIAPLDPRQLKVLKRFRSVFELAIRRYADIQKVEDQARVLQIEMALEKVRSRSLAMHHSDELEQVVASLFNQLIEVGLSFDGALIFIFEKEKRNILLWIATSHLSAPVRIDLPYDEHIKGNAIIKDLWNAIETGEHLFNKSYSGETKNEYFRYVVKYNESKIPEEVRKIQIEANAWTAYFAAEKNSIVGFDSWSGHNITREDFQTLTRFARVFEQSYTRFLDLQKAEAQAREAKIEAALERVRSKTMAMHNTDDMGDTVVTMFDELVKLGVKTNRCGVLIHNDSVFTEVWTAKANPDGKATLIVGHLDTTTHAMLTRARKSWLDKESFFCYELVGVDIKNYYQIINDSKDYRYHIDLDALPLREIHSDFHFREGSIFAFTEERIPDEISRIFHRFAAVFGQTYTRFLDLQKAEAQAREAKIEAALEKVRGKAMAMHNSADLTDAASTVFTELRKLGINPIRFGVGIIQRETQQAQLYTATTSDGKDTLSLMGSVSLSAHPVLEGIHAAWARKENYFPVLKGEELRSYYEVLLAGLPVPKIVWQEGDVQHGHFLSFSEGCLYLWAEKPYGGPDLKILDRFKTIIDLTFRRYIELQRVEANARDATRQSSLDRVRAEIASMRTKQDLDRITPLIWNELTILGIPFARCGVFIMNDSQRQVHAFLSTPDGKAIGAFQLDYETTNLKDAIKHWHANQVYVTHWGGKEFGEMASTLLEQGSIANLDQYLHTLPEEGIYLHFVPFLQGMLYVGNINSLQEEDVRLLQSLADAFSTAYARYEDFIKLETAKQQVDQALVELKQTQQQLVQSEKMASLGELTAGIAHEIQNPLNFVNNFSEVSNELIEEMVQEVNKGNFEEARAIANDVRQNLEKINHHGKRADGIVKSMLQHSRTSSGQKELTDINILCDEYLRLSFHGLRAKDKSFNAKFETDFDSTLQKIDVIPQEIGRVILNLINNAFYAVTEKRRVRGNGYEPVVSIQTRKLQGRPDDPFGRGSVQISVNDNGSGVPQKVLDKIFQPFFTTKAAGQGTGLGLSLSYDIVKAHGGSLNVETKEGEGSTFIIQLPG